MQEEGIARQALDRVHAPVGLDETPETIAVSVAAQLLRERRRAVAPSPADPLIRSVDAASQGSMLGLRVRWVPLLS